MPPMTTYPSANGQNIALGIAMGLLAASGLSAMDACVKYLAQEGYSVLFTQGTRAIMSFVLFGAIIVMRGESLSLNRPGWRIVMLRGVLMGIGTIFVFTALARIDISLMTTILFIYPLIVGLLGAVFLNEPLGPRRILAMIAGFAGVWIASGVTFGPDTQVDWALVLPAIAACIIAVSNILVRFVPKDLTHNEMNFINVVGMDIVALPLMLFNLEPIQTWTHAAFFLLAGIFSTIGSYGLAVAFRVAPAGLVGSVNYSSVLVATLLGWLFFNEVPTAWLWLAILLIVGSGVIFTLLQHRER